MRTNCYKDDDNDDDNDDEEQQKKDDAVFANFLLPVSQVTVYEMT